MTISDLGEMLYDLCDNQSAWSQKTFGSDSERGPIGALKHLILEAQEAIEHPEDREEYADCLLLILDASRRAGMTPMQLLAEATAKQQRNAKREWPAPTSDEPVQHVRNGA